MATDRLGNQGSQLFRNVPANEENQRYPGIFDPFRVRTSQPEVLHMPGSQPSEQNPLMTRLAASGGPANPPPLDATNVLNFDFRNSRTAGGLRTVQQQSEGREVLATTNTPSPSFLNPSPANSHHEGLRQPQQHTPQEQGLAQGVRLLREERGAPVEAGRTELPRVERDVVVLDSERRVVRGPEYGQQQITENKGKMRVIQSEIRFTEVPKSVEEVTQQPQVVERVIEKPFEVLTYKPKTIIKNVDVPVTVIEENPIEKLIQREVYTHVQKITPIERHYEVPVERVVEVPVHRVLEREVHMQQIVEVPVERVVDRIVEQRVQVPVYKDTIVQVDSRSIPQARNPNDIILPTKIEQKEEIEIVEQPEIIQQIREVVKEVPIEREVRREVVVDIPRTVEKPVQRVVYVDQYEDVIVEIPGQQLIQEQEVIVEKKTENYIQVPRDLFEEIQREKGSLGGQYRPNAPISDTERREFYTPSNYIPGNTQVGGPAQFPAQGQLVYKTDQIPGNIGSQIGYPGSRTSQSHRTQPGDQTYLPAGTIISGIPQSQGTVSYQPGAYTTLIPGQPQSASYNHAGSSAQTQPGLSYDSTRVPPGTVTTYTPGQADQTTKYYQGQPGSTISYQPSQPQPQGTIRYVPGAAGSTTVIGAQGTALGSTTTLHQTGYLPYGTTITPGLPTVPAPGSTTLLPQPRPSGTALQQQGGYSQQAPQTPQTHSPLAPAAAATTNNNGRVWQIPIDRVIEETHIVPIEKTIERHIDHIVNVPVERIVDIPVHVDNIVEKVVPVERIVEYPVKKIVEVPVFKEKIQEKQVFIERIEAEEVEKLVEKIIRKPVERIVEVPIEVTKYRPVIKKVEREEVIQLETQVRRDSEIEVLEMVDEEEDSELRSQVEALNRRVQDMEQENQQLRSQYERLERAGANPTEGRTTTVQSYDYSSACNELQQRIASVQSRISEYEAKLTDTRLRN